MRDAGSANRSKLIGVSVVLTGISLAFGLAAWWSGGQQEWQLLRLAGPLGLGFLGLAMIVGPRARRRYYTLLAVSLTLTALSLLSWWTI